MRAMLLFHDLLSSAICLLLRLFFNFMDFQLFFVLKARF